MNATLFIFLIGISMCLCQGLNITKQSNETFRKDYNHFCNNANLNFFIIQECGGSVQQCDCFARPCAAFESNGNCNFQIFDTHGHRAQFYLPSDQSARIDHVGSTLTVYLSVYGRICDAFATLYSNSGWNNSDC